MSAVRHGREGPGGARKVPDPRPGARSGRARRGGKLRARTQTSILTCAFGFR